MLLVWLLNNNVLAEIFFNNKNTIEFSYLVNGDNLVLSIYVMSFQMNKIPRSTGIKITEFCPIWDLLKTL